MDSPPKVGHKILCCTMWVWENSRNMIVMRTMAPGTFSITKMSGLRNKISKNQTIIGKQLAPQNCSMLPNDEKLMHV